MEIKTSEELESTGYRCLFECVKQEGIEPIMHFLGDVKYIPSKEMLVRQAILDGKNDLLKLVRRNRDVIKYLREHKKELARLSLMSDDVYHTLNELSNDISLIDLYLENAKRLEELKVSKIDFVTFYKFGEYTCGIFRNERDEIITITKYYTDGQIRLIGQEREKNKFSHYSVIPFSIDSREAMSFLLRAENNEKGLQHRGIQIKNFGFNGTKLPTEEEIKSYEIPKEYILK